MSEKAYDKVKWHSHADSAPKDLPYEYGATHISFMFRWVYENKLFNKETLTDIQAWQKEQYSLDFRQILVSEFDGWFGSDLLNTKGKKFLNAYYTSEKTKFAKQFNWYLQDYTDFIKHIFGKKYEDNSYYYYQWNEENYQTVKKIIDERYQQFLSMTARK